MSQDYLRNNWQVTPILETRWETDVVPSASSQAECRRQILTRPLRTLRFSITSLGDSQISRLIMTLFRISDQDYEVPLYPDVVVTDAPSSLLSLKANPTDRRFFAGHKIVILPWDGGSVFDDPIVRTIDTVNPSDITLTANLVGVIPAGSLVFPIMQSHKILGSGVTFVRQGVASWAGLSFERSGVLVSIPESHDHTAVAGFPTHESLPVLDLDEDWGENLEITYTKNGEIFTLGRDLLVNNSPAKGRWVFDLNFIFSDRADFTQLLNFFDSRRGRLLPFWAVARAPFFEFLTITTSFVEVTDSFDHNDFSSLVTHMAVVLKDGTIYIREALSIATVGQAARITFLNVIPATPDSDVAYIALAAKSRFLNDALEEVWLTDDTCRVGVKTIELLSEVDNEVTNVDYVPGTEFTAC